METCPLCNEPIEECTCPQDDIDDCHKDWLEEEYE